MKTIALYLTIVVNGSPVNLGSVGSYNAAIITPELCETGARAIAVEFEQRYSERYGVPVSVEYECREQVPIARPSKAGKPNLTTGPLKVEGEAPEPHDYPRPPQ